MCCALAEVSSRPGGCYAALQVPLGAVALALACHSCASARHLHHSRAQLSRMYWRLSDAAQLAADKEACICCAAR